MDRMARPTIGITFSRQAKQETRLRYVQALERAGAEVVVIYPEAPGGGTGRRHGALQGLVLAGGGDVVPAIYQAKATAPARSPDALRDVIEVSLVRACVKRPMPILGVCRGIQVINAALGGTLWQDLPSQRPSAVAHDRGEGDESTHAIVAEEGFVRTIFGAATEANSHHHQGIRDLAPGLKAVARTLDGLVEAVEHVGAPIYAVQWHPERMGEEGEKVFRWFVGGL